VTVTIVTWKADPRRKSETAIIEELSGLSNVPRATVPTNHQGKMGCSEEGLTSLLYGVNIEKPLISPLSWQKCGWFPRIDPLIRVYPRVLIVIWFADALQYIYFHEYIDQNP
jgi:hypothetical protein